MVAMNVWPTDGAAGSVATEARWRSMARHWTPSGVLAGVGNQLTPSLAVPNLTVQSGAAWVDGHYAELPAVQVLPVTANGIAVVRFDPAANTAELLWRDGVTTPTQNPTGTWEMVIASITANVLTDQRVTYNAQQSLSTGVNRYPNASARNSAIPVPAINQLTELDTARGRIDYWDGGAWVDVTGYDYIYERLPNIQLAGGQLTTITLSLTMPQTGALTITGNSQIGWTAGDPPNMIASSVQASGTSPAPTAIFPAVETLPAVYANANCYFSAWWQNIARGTPVTIVIDANNVGGPMTVVWARCAGRVQVRPVINPL